MAKVYNAFFDSIAEYLAATFFLGLGHTSAAYTNSIGSNITAVGCQALYSNMYVSTPTPKPQA
jgi:hypothetical protein